MFPSHLMMQIVDQPNRHCPQISIPPYPYSTSSSNSNYYNSNHHHNNSNNNYHHHHHHPPHHHNNNRHLVHQNFQQDSNGRGQLFHFNGNQTRQRELMQVIFLSYYFFFLIYIIRVVPFQGFISILPIVNL